MQENKVTHLAIEKVDMENIRFLYLKWSSGRVTRRQISDESLGTLGKSEVVVLLPLWLKWIKVDE